MLQNIQGDTALRKISGNIAGNIKNDMNLFSFDMIYSDATNNFNTIENMSLPPS